MKKVEGLAIKYVGYNEPQTVEEVEMEILGLETAIAAAKQRIAVLKQSVKLQSIMMRAKQEQLDETTVSETAEAADSE